MTASQPIASTPLPIASAAAGVGMSEVLRSIQRVKSPGPDAKTCESRKVQKVVSSTSARRAANQGEKR